MAAIGTIGDFAARANVRNERRSLNLFDELFDTFIISDIIGVTGELSVGSHERILSGERCSFNVPEAGRQRGAGFA